MSDQMLSLLDNIKSAKVEIESLRAELAAKDAKIQRLESRGISDMQWELKEKDQRIEEIENIAASSGKANVRLMNKIDCLNKYIEELEGARIRALEGGE